MGTPPPAGRRTLRRLVLVARYRTFLGLAPIEWVSYAALLLAGLVCVAGWAGCAGQDLTGIRSEITGIRARVDDIDVRVGGIENSPQTGIINISSSSGFTLAGYAVSILLSAAAYWCYRRHKRATTALRLVKAAIDSIDNTQAIKAKIAKAEAQTFGEIARVPTDRHKKTHK